MLYNILIIVEVVVSIVLTLLILLQQGKGADAGAAFGSGASGTVFGSRGTASFMGKATGVLAFVFMANSTAMAYLSHQQTAPTSVVERAAAAAQAHKTEAGNASQGTLNAPGTPTTRKESPAHQGSSGQAAPSKSQPAKQQPAPNKQPPADGQGG
ncbi:MAG TPA: preprotein translocase subunit SecG [Gammaproteobacteria bacterium]|nr:preprotein translocase subunit SecG [Gammaproteobacteria bacterium]